MVFDDGATVGEVAEWLIDNRYAEVSSSEGRINAYLPTKRGRDLTVADNPVLLVEGVNLKDAPWERSWDDVASAVTVVGGETPDPKDDTKTRPRVKVRVTRAASTAPSTTVGVDVPIGYGNIYGGYTLVDKDWQPRVIPTAQKIAGMGVAVFAALELHHEADGGVRMLDYFMDRMRAIDTDIAVFEGKGGDQLLYRKSMIVPVAVSSVMMPANRWLNNFTVKDKASGFTFQMVVAHFIANDLDGTSRIVDKRAQAQFAADYMAKVTQPAMFMADINDFSNTAGNGRDILESSGLLGLRQRGPVINGEFDSFDGAQTGVWIEDIWTRAAQRVTAAEAVKTAGVSDHFLWLKATVGFDTVRAAQPGDYGIRERRLNIEGVQSSTTLKAIGEKWLADRLEPRVSRTYATPVVEHAPAPVLTGPSVAEAPPAVFKPYRTFTPGNDSYPFQDVAFGLRYTYTSQRTPTAYPEDLIVTRWLGSKRSGEMRFTDGGHGDDLEVETIRGGSSTGGDIDYLIFPYGAQSFFSSTKDDYVRVPWKSGTTMSKATALTYRLKNLPDRDPYPLTSWMQGEPGPSTATTGAARHPLQPDGDRRGVRRRHPPVPAADPRRSARRPHRHHPARPRHLR